MVIAVIGGSGTLGSHVVGELRARGHDVRAPSRRAAQFRIDLTTGEGLEHAVDGCEVVVDASNNSSPRGAARTLVEGSRRLLAAEQAAGVRHHVCVSIVGCDRVPLGYYRVKVEQEGVTETGAVPWSIVRATQFHELIATAFSAAARLHVLPMAAARLQTVAARQAADAVADVAEGGPLGRKLEVAGPEVCEARELARLWRLHAPGRVLALPLPLPGKLGRALRQGGLTTETPDVRGTLTFADWLAGDATATTP
jgi:uncharacterized protein YbjT (DUF2867 family)